MCEKYEVFSETSLLSLYGCKKLCMHTLFINKELFSLGIDTSLKQTDLCSFYILKKQIILICVHHLKRLWNKLLLGLKPKEKRS